MTDELKPCPFCGGRPNSWHHRSPFGISNICDVYCNRGDHSVIVTGNSKEEAFAVWNARFEPEELPEWAKFEIKRMVNWAMPNPEYARGYSSALEDVLSLRKPEVKNE